MTSSSMSSPSIRTLVYSHLPKMSVNVLIEEIPHTYSVHSIAPSDGHVAIGCTLECTGERMTRSGIERTGCREICDNRIGSWRVGMSPNYNLARLFLNNWRSA